MNSKRITPNHLITGDTLYLYGYMPTEVLLTADFAHRPAGCFKLYWNVTVRHEDGATEVVNLPINSLVKVAS